MFQQLRSTRLLRMPSQALLWQKLAFSSPFPYFNYLSSILLFRRHCDVVLFTRHLVLSKIMFFHAYPFNRSVGPFAQVLFALSSLASLLTGVPYEFVLPCSSSLPECFQLCSTSWHSYFQVVQLLKVLWFHSFVKGAT